MYISVTIRGVTPLLMNRFTADKAVKEDGTPVMSGEPGTPREQAAVKRYYDDNGHLFIPGASIFACLIAAGKFQKVGKSKLTTMKTSLVPAGLAVEELDCLLHTPEGDPIADWEVDSRSVVVPSTGGRIMCHRPRIDRWDCTYTLDIDSEMFTENVIRKLVDDGGKKIGLCDYRPSRKGPFGRYVVVKWVTLEKSTLQTDDLEDARATKVAA